jgi:hypothetical protein
MVGVLAVEQEIKSHVARSLKFPVMVCLLTNEQRHEWITYDPPRWGRTSRQVILMATPTYTAAMLLAYIVRNGIGLADVLET